MTKMLELLAAVDVADGKAVRLTQGHKDAETDFGSPLEVAQTFIDAGAQWVHLVDLDAAFGRGNNRTLIAEVIAQTNNVKIQLSGGIRDEDSLTAALELGVTRVNLATNALDDLSWTISAIKRFGDQVAVGLDVRGTTLMARGSSHASGNLIEVLERLEAAGCARYVVTDVAKDGTLGGPNLDLLRTVLKRTNKPVVASGGISSLQDITDLRALVEHGLEGAILGKALYAHKFSLQDALEIATAK
jgi:1-(5-phosphoribosyl)-5-[(5-phosphoribosylamino)methylideneamino] imidazole-4-carboxamide isomerase/N-(5'phosphoribosyl)anthranilate isomerase